VEVQLARLALLATLGPPMRPLLKFVKGVPTVRACPSHAANARMELIRADLVKINVTNVQPGMLAKIKAPVQSCVPQEATHPLDQWSARDARPDTFALPQEELSGFAPMDRILFQIGPIASYVLLATAV
jgi:hypothetical protein